MKRRNCQSSRIGFSMSRIRLAIFAILTALLGSVANAGVFERDWKSPGDGLLTYDNVNQREWLDLSQSLLSDQFPSSGANISEIRESRYQYVFSQTAPGGVFDEFTVATSDDVVALAQAAGIDTSTESYVVNSSGTSLLTNLLGYTFEATNGNKFVIGLLDELFETASLRRASADFLLLEGFGTQAGLQLGSGHFQYPTPPGVFLYRVVPEPATAFIATTSLLLPLFFRRTKH